MARLKRIGVHAALLGVAGLFATGAQALLIDDFNTDASVVVTGAAPANGNVATPDSGAGMIGDRALIVSKTLGPGGGVVNAAIAEVSGGVLGMANGPVTNSVITSSWIFGATDLTEGGLSTGLFLSLPSAIDNDLNIAFSINGGPVLNRLFPNGSSGNDFFIPFADFANAGAAASATSLSLVFSDGPAWDAQIDFIETRPENPPPPPVPAPGTLLLLGLGLISLAARYKRS